MRISVSVLTACLPWLGLLGVASPASATFAGNEGRLVAETFDDQTGDAGSTLCDDCDIGGLIAVSPRTRRAVPFRVCRSGICRDSNPAPSPDGRRVAFTRQLRNGSGDPLEGEATSEAVLVANASGTQVKMLVQNGDQAAWSPDGRRIAFLRDGNVHVVRADGTGDRVLIRSRRTFVSEVDWSSRGLLVLQRRFGSQSRLYVASSSGRRVRRLQSRLTMARPSWSPDGRRLAYLRQLVRADGEIDSSNLVIARADGTHRRKLARGVRNPVWSPTGRRIAFSRGPDIRVIGLRSGGKSRRLFTLPFEGGIQTLSWLARPHG